MGLDLCHALRKKSTDTCKFSEFFRSLSARQLKTGKVVVILLDNFSESVDIIFLKSLYLLAVEILLMEDRQETSTLFLIVILECMHLVTYLPQ